MTQTDTSTEAVERLANHHDLLHPKVETVTLFAETSVETAEALRALAAERDTLSKQVEDTARVCAEQADEIRSTKYVPGVWRCAKCEFELVQSFLNAGTGTITARDDPGETCPNCGTTLWRVSWKDWANETAQRLDETWDELQALKKRALKSEPAPRAVSVQEAAKVLLDAPRSKTGPMAHAGRVAEEFIEDVECGGEITTEIIEAFLRTLAQET